MTRPVSGLIAVALTSLTYGAAVTRVLATQAQELWITSQGTDTIYIREFPTAKKLGQIILPTHRRTTGAR